MATKNTLHQSTYKGVTWNTRTSRWRVQVSHNGTSHYAGSFRLEEERKAALAYDKKAASLGIKELNILKLKTI